MSPLRRCHRRRHLNAGDVKTETQAGALAKRRFTVEERRSRLARRHHLAPKHRAKTATEVARDIVGLHGTDPATVFVAAWARMRSADVAGIETELYDARSLVRVLVMRRTIFALPPDIAAIALASCKRSVGEVQRRQLLKWIEVGGIAKNPAAWLKKVEGSAFAALAARGQATTAELMADVPSLREQVVLTDSSRNEVRQNIGPFVIRLLAVDGLVMRGRPRGGWLSTQYSWATTREWVREEMREWAVHEAQAELLRLWLEAFGPATVEDVRWWTGWTMGEVRRALTEVKPVEVDIGGASGIVLAGDLDPTPEPKPWAALLPGLDPSVMGWTERDWYLGAHRAALFDRSGNAGPTIWWDGRVVGGWAQRHDGEIVLRLLEDIGRDAKAAVDAEAERLRRWLGDRRVLPRFATPLVKELAASAEAAATASKRRARSAPLRSPGRRQG